MKNQCTFCTLQFASPIMCIEHEQTAHMHALQAMSRLHGQIDMLRKQLKTKRDEITVLRKQHNPLYTVCTLCYERRKMLAFAPCSHSICDTCFAKLQGSTHRKKCPWCRKAIVSTVQLHICTL